MTEGLRRYNKLCPVHPSGWGTQRWMRDDDIVCVDCYKSLPSNLRDLLWVQGDQRAGNLSIVIDWLLEHQEGDEIVQTEERS